MPNFSQLTIPSAPRLWTPGKSTPTPLHSRNIHVLHAWSVHRNAKGEILWDEGEWMPNILHDEGEQAILSAYFDTDLAGFGAPPANLYLGLDNRTALAEADTLAMGGFNELTVANGYARIAVSTTSGFTLSQPGTYYKASTATLTFTASGGNWTAAKHRFLTTVASGTSGKLVASLALSSTRTVLDGDQLDTTMVVGLSE